MQTKRRQRQGVWAVEEFERTVAMSTVTPSADDEPVQVFVVPAHDELPHMMQLRNRDLLGNQESPPDRRAHAPQGDSQLENGRCFDASVLRKRRSPSTHYKHFLQSYSQKSIAAPALARSLISQSLLRAPSSSVITARASWIGYPLPAEPAAHGREASSDGR